MPQGTYSFLDLDEDVDEDRTATTCYAPFENMLSATQLVVSSLTTQPEPSHQFGIPEKASRIVVDSPIRQYAIQGGFSMQLRDGRKSTRDIDLVTSIKMKGVWEAITGEDR